MFTFFCTMLSLNIINFIFNSFLLRQNNKIQKSASSLTTRYQREEVTQSTKFAVFVIFCHFSLYGTYVIGIIILRYFGGILITNPMISFYNLSVGTVAVLLNQRMKSKKTEVISVTVQMKSTGNIGAINYDNAISDIWNSVSNR
uniref:7TM_GPCR_Srx domain-containing protein n=1 Tax=Caenorhabditis tropicalis TaxID=1561998 RepID=A0A1I7T9F7_9PELO